MLEDLPFNPCSQRVFVRRVPRPRQKISDFTISELFCSTTGWTLLCKIPIHHIQKRSKDFMVVNMFFERVAHVKQAKTLLVKQQAALAVIRRQQQLRGDILCDDSAFDEPWEEDDLPL